MLEATEQAREKAKPYTEKALEAAKEAGEQAKQAADRAGEAAKPYYDKSKEAAQKAYDDALKPAKELMEKSKAGRAEEELTLEGVSPASGLAPWRNTEGWSNGVRPCSRAVSGRHGSDTNRHDQPRNASPAVLPSSRGPRAASAAPWRWPTPGRART